jgi:hypothetical protein
MPTLCFSLSVSRLAVFHVESRWFVRDPFDETLDLGMLAKFLDGAEAARQLTVGEDAVNLGVTESVDGRDVTLGPTFMDGHEMMATFILGFHYPIA